MRCTLPTTAIDGEMHRECSTSLWARRSITWGSGASKWGVGYRVYQGLNKIGLRNGYPAAPMQGWSELLNKPESKVGIFQFEQSDWYWPLSLEALLVGRL